MLTMVLSFVIIITYKQDSLIFAIVIALSRHLCGRPCFYHYSRLDKYLKKISKFIKKELTIENFHYMMTSIT